MGINIGTSTTSANEVYVGTESIGEIYVGTELVWAKQTGTAPSWPVGSFVRTDGNPTQPTAGVHTITFTATPTDPEGLAGGTYEWYENDTNLAGTTTHPTNSFDFTNTVTFFGRTIRYHCVFTDSTGNSADSSGVFVQWVV